MHKISNFRKDTVGYQHSNSQFMYLERLDGTEEGVVQSYVNSDSICGTAIL